MGTLHIAREPKGGKKRYTQASVARARSSTDAQRVYVHSAEGARKWDSCLEILKRLIGKRS